MRRTIRIAGVYVNFINGQRGAACDKLRICPVKLMTFYMAHLILPNEIFIHMTFIVLENIKLKSLKAHLAAHGISPSKIITTYIVTRRIFFFMCALSHKLGENVTHRGLVLAVERQTLLDGQRQAFQWFAELNWKISYI